MSLPEQGLIDELAVELATSGDFGRKTRLPAIRQPDGSLSSLTDAVKAIKQLLDSREGVSGSVLDRALSLRDLVDAGALQLNIGGRVIGAASGSALQFIGQGDPGPPGPPGDPGLPGGGFADPRPILAKPPTLGSLTATGTFKTVFIDWTMSEYQNHRYVEMYRANTNSRGSAVLIGTSTSNIYVDESAAIGIVYYYWARAVGITAAGVTIYGDDNAVGGTSGGRQLIGNVDLGPLIVEAGNLANGSVTANKILNGEITLTKFASGLEPPTIITGGSLPTTYVTKIIFWTTDSKLYRWNGTAYTKAVDGADIIANSIIAGTIQAGAVGTNELAATSVTAGKMLITGNGPSLNADPSLRDVSLWTLATGVFPAQVDITNGPAGFKAFRFNGMGAVLSERLPVVANRQYRVAMYGRQVSGIGRAYLRLFYFDASGALISYVVTSINPSASGPLENLMMPSTWTRYVGTSVAPSNTAYAQINVYGNFNEPGVAEFQDIRCDEYIGADLIVDGGIQANHLAANSIAVGTAAIQNGALVNAMIANLAVDDAKVVNLSANKITFGEMSGDRISVNSLFGNRITVNTLLGDRLIANSVTSDKIDGRGLVIRDNSNNPILGVNVPLSIGYVPSGALNSNVGILPNGTLSNAGGGQVTLPGIGLRTFRVASRGYSGASHPIAEGLYDADTGAALYGSATMYSAAKINRATGVVSYVGAWNTLAGAANSANMAAALNAIGSDHIVVVWTTDEPFSYRMEGGLPQAMYRHGASPSIFGSPNFQIRGAYVLVSVGACGEGNGFESYSGAFNSDPNAWCDVAFTVRNGNLIVTGAAKTPSSVRDLGYIGDIDATKGASWNSNITGQPSDASIANINIGINAGGQFYGGGAGSGVVVSNAQMSVGADGQLYSAGVPIPGAKVTIAGLGYQGSLYATYGADWGTTLSGIPTAIGDGRVATAIDGSGVLISRVRPGALATPTSTGLYMGSDYMGFYNAAGGGWKTYMSNTGDFFLGGPTGALQWNGANLFVNGSVGTTGAFFGGKGGYFSDAPGFWMGMVGGYGRFHFGDANAYIRWDEVNGITQKLNTFTVSLSPSNIFQPIPENYPYPNLDASLGPITATPLGGIGPYRYVWSLITTSVDPNDAPLNIVHYSSGNTCSIAISQQRWHSSIYGILSCLVTDVNGRAYEASMGFTSRYGTA